MFTGLVSFRNGLLMPHNQRNSYLFSKNREGANHIQNRPESWATATDEEHLEGMRTEVTRVNPQWNAYLEKYRPKLLKRFLEERRSSIRKANRIIRNS